VVEEASAVAGVVEVRLDLNLVEEEGEVQIGAGVDVNEERKA